MSRPLDNGAAALPTATPETRLTFMSRRFLNQRVAVLCTAHPSFILGSRSLRKQILVIVCVTAYLYWPVSA